MLLSYVGPTGDINPEFLLGRVDLIRSDISRQLSPERKAELGQFLTPQPVAQLMASMIGDPPSEVTLLDPGAGIGSLFAAAVAELCRRERKPKRISIVAYEVDPLLAEYAMVTADLCRATCNASGVLFDAKVINSDFLRCAVEFLHPDLFSRPDFQSVPYRFSTAILNPPYKKISMSSPYRLLLRRMGIETTNLYTGFLATVFRLLQSGGELIAITPRSFCNGTYFRGFRSEFLADMSLRRIHVFGSRDHAFREDEVLQENVIVRAVRSAVPPDHVLVTSSSDSSDAANFAREVAYPDVVHPNDPQLFIRIVTDGPAHNIAYQMRDLKSSLAGLGLSVSTGRVVEFRAEEFLRSAPDANTAPLINSTHFERGFVQWPKELNRKPDALLIVPKSQHLLIPSETYVLVKRVSAKEEKKRLVAAVYDPSRIKTEQVGIENHVNYIHSSGRGIESLLALGVAAFLNASIVDIYFRQFNGHTQVNATDLRSLPMPTAQSLRAIGKCIHDHFPDQAEIDRIVEEEIAV